MCNLSASFSFSSHLFIRFIHYFIFHIFSFKRLSHLSNLLLRVKTYSILFNPKNRHDIYFPKGKTIPSSNFIIRLLIAAERENNIIMYDSQKWTYDPENPRVTFLTFSNENYYLTSFETASPPVEKESYL